MTDRSSNDVRFHWFSIPRLPTQYPAQRSANMPSLLVVVFVLQLSIHLVNTVGANTFNELACTIFIPLCSSLPMFRSFIVLMYGYFNSYGLSTTNYLPRPAPLCLSPRDYEQMSYA